jgi:hypothetical protein
MFIILIAFIIKGTGPGKNSLKQNVEILTNLITDNITQRNRPDGEITHPYIK